MDTPPPPAPVPVYRLPLETPDLVIRPYTGDEVEALFRILSDPLTMRFWPRPYTLPETEGWVERNRRSVAENGFGRCAVLWRETCELIGDCGIVQAEVDGEPVHDLGYLLHHPWWGRGLGYQAAAAMLEYGFRGLGLEAVHANMPADHHASRRVAEKLGMRRVREFHNPRNRGILTYLYRAARPGA